MRSFTTKPLIVCALISFTACATTPDYTPMSDKTANFRGVIIKGNLPDTQMGDTLFTNIYDSQSCDNRRSMDVVFVSSGKNKTAKSKLNMPMSDYGKYQSYEAQMDADIPYNILMSFSILNGGPFSKIDHCDVMFETQFNAGGNYEAVGTFDDRNQCHVVLNEIVGEGDTAMRREIMTYTNVTSPAKEECLVR